MARPDMIPLGDSEAAAWEASAFAARAAAGCLHPQLMCSQVPRLQLPVQDMRLGTPRENEENMSMTKEQAVAEIDAANKQYLKGTITRGEWHEAIDVTLTVEASGWMTIGHTPGRVPGGVT